MNTLIPTFPLVVSRRVHLSLFALAACAVVAVCLAPLPARAADVGKTFATPQAAAAALAAAANARDRVALRDLFGLATDELVATDLVQASNELSQFTLALNQTNRITPRSDSQCLLEIGTNFWPFPIPIVKKDGQWFFDTEAGKDELLSRRIGRNELATLEVVRTYVEAQREYASRDHDGDDVLEYAQHLLSSPGSKDGLYWAPELDGEISPLGPLVADAQGEGYNFHARADDSGPQPFHGYYFKVLTRQGKHAPGGKYDYVINGNMIGGFALLAWPAQYGESGIMSFIVNQQGRVYQRDLGPKTPKLASSIKSYDPGPGWVVSPD
jgi:hypothetical protein